MIVFIQHRKTLDYLTADTKWTPDRHKALSFGTSSDAFTYCLDHFLSDCDILLHFGRSAPDVRLPFRPGQPAGTAKSPDPPTAS